MSITQTLEAFMEAIDTVEWDKAEPLLGEDFVLDDPAGRRHVGRDAFRLLLAQWRQRIEDLAFADRVIMANEDESRGAVEFVLRGQRGSERVSVPAGAFFDVDEGQVNRMTFRLDPNGATLLS